MADNSVELQVLVEIRDAVKSLNSFEKESKDATDKVSGYFSNLKNVAKVALAVVASKELIDFFIESASAAANSEAQTAKLTASLKSLGEFTPDAIKDFREFAQVLQETSKFSDDAAVAQLAYAKQLGLTNEKAKELVQAGADLASITGDSLDSAVSELGRTLTGTAGALARTVPEVKGFTEEQLKAGAAIDLISRRLKGSAKEAIETYQGALIQLGNSFEDFEKAVGRTITQNPQVIQAIKELAKFFGGAENVVTSLSEYISAYFSAAIVNVSKLLNFLVVDVLGAFLTELGRVAEGLVGIVGIFAQLTGNALGTGDAILAAGKNLKDFIQKGAKGLADFSVSNEKAIANIVNADNKATDSMVGNQEKVTTVDQKAREELKKQYETFKRQVLDRQVDDLKKIDFERSNNLKDLQKYEKKGVVATKEAAELRAAINAKAEQDIKEARKKAFEEFKKDVSDAAANPITFIFDPVKSFDIPKIGKEFARGIAAGIGTLSDILKGKQGAEDLVKAAAAALGDAILPGIGPAVSEIVGVLSKGKDQTVQFIKEFSDALPGILQNLLEALPYVMPQVAESLVDSLIVKGGIKRIAVELVQNMAKQNGILFQAGRQIAIGLAQGLGQSYKDGANQFAMAIKNAAPIVEQAIEDGFNNAIAAEVEAFNNFGSTLKDFVSTAFNAVLTSVSEAIKNGFTDGIVNVYASIGNAIVDGFRFAYSELGPNIIKAFQDAFNAIADQLKGAVTPGGGNNPLSNPFVNAAVSTTVGGGAVTAIASRFATGGMVPAGYPNDSYPARLTSGEAVLPNNVVDKLDSFLKTGGGQQGPSMTDAILLKIFNALQQPQTIQTSINIGSRELAQAILELSRSNQRVVA